MIEKDPTRQSDKSDGRSGDKRKREALAQEGDEEPQQRRSWPIYALFLGNTISYIGDIMTFLAIPWFVLQTTGSVELTGITGFFSALPLVFSAFFGDGDEHSRLRDGKRECRHKDSRLEMRRIGSTGPNDGERSFHARGSSIVERVLLGLELKRRSYETARSHVLARKPFLRTSMCLRIAHDSID